jgi:lipopolysaccharide export system protein LptA
MAKARRPFVSRLLVAGLVTSIAAIAIARPPSPPLIMENADRLEGVRSTGEHILSGNVRFRHGDLLLETQRAVWERPTNRVISEQGMRVTQRGSRLTADRGTYDRGTERALAEGRVFMRDSAGLVEARGERLDYDRVTRIAELSGNPVAKRFYPAGRSYPGGDSSAIPEEVPADTLTIRGRKLRFNDSAGVAEAEGGVVITRRDLRITCERAEYRRNEDSLILRGNPVAKIGDSEIRGALMRMGMQGELLRGLRVRGAAEALSLEKATDSTRARQSRVTGDSLFAAFRDGALDSVEVFTKAEGTYWEPARPAYVNRMSGAYMVLRFRDRVAREADVLGSARSTYYHFERDTLRGRNRAGGDAISMTFENGKVREVLVRGSASGVYEGRALGSGKRDSARAAREAQAAEAGKKALEKNTPGALKQEQGQGKGKP